MNHVVAIRVVRHVGRTSKFVNDLSESNASANKYKTSSVSAGFISIEHLMGD
jgi:hypothetical protein